MNTATSTTNRKLSHVLLKAIAVNGLNFLVFIGIFLLVRELPKKAQEVKTVLTEVQASQQAADTAVLKSEIEKSRDKIDTLTKLFSGDQTVISFVSDMDELKAAGVISEYEFPITALITDKSGIKGLPVAITAKGSKEAVNIALQKISSLKTLVKPITLSMTISESGEYVAKFGGFLYVQ